MKTKDRTFQKFTQAACNFLLNVKNGRAKKAKYWEKKADKWRNKWVIENGYNPLTFNALREM